MAAYHQLGNASENLVMEPALAGYQGVILSPVDYSPEKVASQVTKIRDANPKIDIILDPQMYVLRSSRRNLPQWPYFPAKVDTEDSGTVSWWQPTLDALVKCADDLKVDGVCSPIALPAKFTDEYYSFCIAVGQALLGTVNPGQARPIQSAIVELADLQNDQRCLEVASILSKSQIPDLYLTFFSDTKPRKEVIEGDVMRGAMRLINLLSQAGYRITVGCSSSDMLLWRVAGASACATGKFFNLRRFSRSRWDDPIDGGQNVAYWFEESLVAFIRESDVVRLAPQQRLHESYQGNPFAVQILEIIESNKTVRPPDTATAWVGLGWRQYMFWFLQMDQRIDEGLDVGKVLANAESNWTTLEDEDFLMEEKRHEGAWVRPWRRALIEFRKLQRG